MCPHPFPPLWDPIVFAVSEFASLINIKTKVKPLAAVAILSISCQNKDVKTDALTKDSLGL